MRKLATAAAVSLVLASGGVRALGLGDIEMRSALNQPMNAEIRLTSVKAGEANGMIVKLASPDAFARAGIERSNALTDLQFAVDDSSGTPIIRISSSKPVVEPFLNFLLEVDWPTGRMVREYTVLLDPPVFMTPSASDGNLASEQPATLQRSDSSLLTPTPIERSEESANFDFGEVEVIGTAVEVDDNSVVVDDGGEEISLADLGDADVVELIDNTADLAADQGDVVVLTDLGVENTEAAEQFQANQDFEFEVDIVGSSDEVSDTFVVGDQGVIASEGAESQFTVSEVGDSELGGSGGDGVEIDLSEFAGTEFEVSQGDDSEIVSLDALDGTSIGTGGGEVTVQRGDTLSIIADANAVPGVSSQQMMMALLSANKNAFINGNVNLVKAGSILRIPDGDELSQLTQTQAIAQVSEQNQLWIEYRDSLRSTTGTRVAAAPTQEFEQPAQPEQPTSQVDPTEQTELSDAAQRILDAAKDEAFNQKELNIVAQSDSTTAAASATADNSQANLDAQLGEINTKLQLAKEELASNRLESIDLAEQSDELQSTAENMESLVNIRQTEVARLEEALRTATVEQEAAEQAAAEQAAAEQAAAEQAAAEQAAAEQAALESDAAGADAVEADADEVVAATENAMAKIEDAAADSEDDVAKVEGEMTDAATESNALTATGETLPEVELVEDSTAQEDAAADLTTATGEQSPWYMQLLQKYGKWLVIGIGALSALLFSLLLLGKRRRKDADEKLDFADEVEFVDESGSHSSVQLNADANVNANADTSGIGSTVAAGAAGAAAIGGVAAASYDSGDDASESLGTHMDVMDETGGPDGIDPDDTISEVDVYLAYGLHGQAEELLTKAIDRDPANHEYALKLLQTQHAQGNADAFSQGAEQYHQNFGGDAAPDWENVCNLGHDLQPDNNLFASSAATVERIGQGTNAMDADDFNSEDLEGSVGSVSRDFGDAAQDADDDVDETDLMDQSLDPAFAFDESDLEATGDFSQIGNGLDTEEVSISSETLADDTSLDFPGFDASDTISGISDAGKDTLGAAGSAASGAASGAGSSLKAGLGGLAAGGAAAAGGLAAKAKSAKDSASGAFDDALSLDSLDNAASAANDGTQGSVSDDLTLDLDQLSGDLELDGGDILDQTSVTGLDDIDIPDLTGDNELLTDADLLGDNVSHIEGSDEMDTMMDLAKAYIDMGDKDSASSALDEIVKSGSPAQVSEAETLKRKIS